MNSVPQRYDAIPHALVCRVFIIKYDRVHEKSTQKRHRQARYTNGEVRPREMARRTKETEKKKMYVKPTLFRCYRTRRRLPESDSCARNIENTRKLK